MKPDVAASTVTCSRETGSRKSKRGKQFHPLAESSAVSPTASSKGSSRAAGATTASVIVNISSVSSASASGTSVSKDQVTGSGSSGNNWNKQHSSSSTFSSPFGRFSLRRLLNPVNLTRTAMATTAAAVSSAARTPSSARPIPAIDSSDTIRVSQIIPSPVISIYLLQTVI